MCEQIRRVLPSVTCTVIDDSYVITMGLESALPAHPSNGTTSIMTDGSTVDSSMILYRLNLTIRILTCITLDGGWTFP